MDAQEFGKYLRTVRNKVGITLIELKDATGLSQPYLSQIENGHKGIPSPEILKKLATPLGISYEELMRRAGYLTVKSFRQIEYGVDTQDEVDRIEKLSDDQKKAIKLYANNRELIKDLLRIRPTAMNGFWDQNKDIFDNRELTIELLDELIKTRPDESVIDLINFLFDWSKEYMILEHDGEETYAYTKSEWNELTNYLKRSELTYNGKLLTPPDHLAILDMLEVLFRERT